MGEILFEKAYSAPCEDLDDINSFPMIVQTNPIFMCMGEKDKILFIRFATECALLAERLECKLSVEHCDEGDECVRFLFSAHRFSFSVNEPMPFTDLMKYDAMDIETDGENVIITVSFFL